jgi:hypothetical protein
VKSRAGRKSRLVAELQVTAALLVAGMTSVGSFDAGRADTYAEVIETNILGFRICWLA